MNTGVCRKRSPFCPHGPARAGLTEEKGLFMTLVARADSRDERDRRFRWGGELNWSEGLNSVWTVQVVAAPGEAAVLWDQRREPGERHFGCVADGGKIERGGWPGCPSRIRAAGP
jgi:hypothetical protein